MGTQLFDGEKLLASLGGKLANIRGRIMPNAEMDKITWFRAGGLAEVLYQPADEEDLAEFMRVLPQEMPVLPVGIGSNLLVRDGGIPGVTIRLAPPSSAVRSSSLMPEGYCGCRFSAFAMPW